MNSIPRTLEVLLVILVVTIASATAAILNLRPSGSVFRMTWNTDLVFAVCGLAFLAARCFRDIWRRFRKKR